MSVNFALFGALLLATSCSAADPIRRVTVHEPDFSIVRTIDDPAGLEQFSQLWAERRVSSRVFPIDFAVVLDIEGGPSEGRWHYHSDGLTRVLSIKHVSTSEVDAVRLNAFLDVSE